MASVEGNGRIDIKPMVGHLAASSVAGFLADDPHQQAVARLQADQARLSGEVGRSGTAVQELRLALDGTPRSRPLPAEALAPDHVAATRRWVSDLRGVRTQLTMVANRARAGVATRGEVAEVMGHIRKSDWWPNLMAKDQAQRNLVSERRQRPFQSDFGLPATGRELRLQRQWHRELQRAERYLAGAGPRDPNFERRWLRRQLNTHTYMIRRTEEAIARTESLGPLTSAPGEPLRVGNPQHAEIEGRLAFQEQRLASMQGKLAANEAELATTLIKQERFPVRARMGAVLPLAFATYSGYQAYGQIVAGHSAVGAMHVLTGAGHLLGAAGVLTRQVGVAATGMVVATAGALIGAHLETPSPGQRQGPSPT